MTGYWTTKEAAAAWGLTLVVAQRIMHRVPGAQQIIENGHVVWRIPANSAKPTADKPPLIRDRVKKSPL